MEKFIGEIAKNKRETLRCEIIEYKGMTLLDLRVYTEIDKCRAPTRKGVSIKIEMIPQIREWLQQAETEAEAAGLLSWHTGKSIMSAYGYKRTLAVPRFYDRL